MYALRSTIIICSFFILFLVVLITSKNVNLQNDQESKISNKKNNLKISEFYKISLFESKKNQPQFELQSEYLNIVEEVRMNFVKPRGIIYSDENSEKYRFSSNLGEFTFKNNKLSLRGEVNLNHKNQTDIIAEEVLYFSKTTAFEAKDSVNINSINEVNGDRFNISANHVRGNMNKKNFEYQGDVIGKLTRKKKYERGLDFKAQKMSVDYNQSLATMSGGVEINRNNFNMLSGRAEIHLENYNKQLKYYTLYDDIKLQERLKLRDGTQVVRKAYADRIEGFNQEKKLVLTGTPRVIQGSDIIKGYKVTLRENLEMVEVDDAASSFTIKKK